MKNFSKKYFLSSSDLPHDDSYRALVERITHNPRVRAAFLCAPRAWFVPDEARTSVPVDAPIAIPGGQTNSQPTTVAIMIEALGPAPGVRVLDVGSGSGWTTALLAELVGADGWVYGIETRTDTYAFGQKNLAYFREKTRLMNFEVREGDGNKGWPEKAPFDRIMVSAGASMVPEALKEQLTPGGRMVIPVDEQDGSQSMVIIQKQNDGSYTERRMPGFRFVPLVNCA